MGVLLEVHGATKRFGGHLAVDDVTLEVHDGEAVGLIGSNGAGKTTLFRMLAGELAMTSGSVRFSGAAPPRRADARARAGMARTYQLVELFGGLTVLEHLLVSLQAIEHHQGPIRDLLGHGATTDAERSRCLETLELCGIAGLVNAPASNLSLGERRSVELARALVTRPRLLLADEPSSGLDAIEAQRLATVLARVRTQSDLAVLIVEHDLVTVQAVAQRVIAMDAGRVIAEGSFDEVVQNPAVIESWLGRPA